MQNTEQILERITSIELKNVNLRSVCKYLYNADEASRLEISKHTALSIPTVASNIHELELKGLAINVGEQQSTGGRRAQLYKFNGIAKISVGVELLKKCYQLVAIDLYGNILKEDSYTSQFSDTDDYFMEFGNSVNKFIDSLNTSLGNILGVGIALQGLVSEDGKTITYSEILGITGTKLERFQMYIKIPCLLVHDTESAALAECWHDPSISNAIYLALNRNFGGTLILNGKVHNTQEQRSSVIEHMCLDPNGPLCYCGKRGCIEVFCSADHLVEKAGMDVANFFRGVNSNKEHCLLIWNEYLDYLALAIDNIQSVVNCDFIIGGYLVQFMTDNDFSLLHELLKRRNSLSVSSFKMRPSRFKDKSPKLGAAMMFVDKFFESL